jgi:hypothetical protein
MVQNGVSKPSGGRAPFDFCNSDGNGGGSRGCDAHPKLRHFPPTCSGGFSNRIRFPFVGTDER